MCKVRAPIGKGQFLHFKYEDKKILLHEINPAFIVLKPSLHGGFKGCNEWIKIANQLNIRWWITSALESNIGLNAIAQFTASVDNGQIHGLGTGSLYTNNFPSPLKVENGNLYYDNQLEWDLSSLKWNIV